MDESCDEVMVTYFAAENQHFENLHSNDGNNKIGNLQFQIQSFITSTLQPRWPIMSESAIKSMDLSIFDKKDTKSQNSSEIKEPGDN